MPKREEAYMQDRRRSILDAALACFLEKGISETSIADIRGACGLSTGALYLHFRDKAEIIAAVAAARRAELAQSATLPSAGDIAAWARLRLAGFVAPQARGHVALDLEILARPERADGAAEAVGATIRAEGERLAASLSELGDAARPAAVVLQAFLNGAGVLAAAYGADRADLEAALALLLDRLVPARKDTPEPSSLRIGPPPVIIRPYDPDRDLERCLAIWRAASEVGHPFLGQEALDADAVLVRDVYMPRAETYVAELEGRVAGFIALLDAMVGGLFVDPAAHGRGFGAALVRHAAAQKGALEVEVYSQNAGARAFYERVGFVETGRRDLDDQGRPHALVQMARPAPG